MKKGRPVGGLARTMPNPQFSGTPLASFFTVKASTTAQIHIGMAPMKQVSRDTASWMTPRLVLPM